MISELYFFKTKAMLFYDIKLFLSVKQILTVKNYALICQFYDNYQNIYYHSELQMNGKNIEKIRISVNFLKYLR